jgi:hypothetical protein
MRILMVICTLLFSVKCLSQNTSLKISLLSLVDEPSFPTIQGGIEFSLGKKISWYNEAGVKYRKSYYDMADTSFVDPRGFKLKSEVRYYLKNRHNVYIGANGFYTKDFHNTEAGYFYTGDRSDYREDNFSVRKIVKGLNVIAGKSYKTWGRSNIEIYGGVGIRFVSVENDNIEIDHTKDVLRRSPDLNIPDNRIWVDVQGEKMVLPNFSLGVRLSFSL